MGIPRGRPKKGQERTTTNVRMYADQAQMLIWVARLSKQTTAQVLDNFLSLDLTKRYLSLRAKAMEVKAKEDELRKALGEPPTPDLPAPDDIPAFMGKIATEFPEQFPPTGAEPDAEGVIDLTAPRPKAKGKRAGRKPAEATPRPN